MLNAYDAMTAAMTWDEMAACARQLTAYVQDDFGAIAGVRPCAFWALRDTFMGGTYFTEDHWLQLYYLYK